MFFQINKSVFAVAVVLALFVFGTNDAKAQKIEPNDGSFEYIIIASDGLNIKLTQNAINYGWTKEGAMALAKNVKFYTERVKKVCSAIKVEKLAHQIQLHAIAWQSRIGWAQRRGNPINVTWREIL
jgi:hypothetical protein